MIDIRIGDVREELKKMESDSVDCVVTSPPYFGLRDYGVETQIGNESSLDEYVDAMVEVFREVRRVLKPTGTLWLNLGDSYASSKNLMLVPARVAIALQADGWNLRSDIIWAKRNCMPESCKDRPTNSHEHIFLFTKRSRGYYFDAESIAEPLSDATIADIKRRSNPGGCEGDSTLLGRGSGLGCGPRVKGFAGAYKNVGEGSATAKHPDKNERGLRLKPDIPIPGNTQDRHGSQIEIESLTRNARNVWEIATIPYPKAHFATFPPEIPRRCVLAGSPVGGLVLDPFAGSGTTLAVAISLGRGALGIELNPEFKPLIVQRCESSNLPLDLFGESEYSNQA